MRAIHYFLLFIFVFLPGCGGGNGGSSTSGTSENTLSDSGEPAIILDTFLVQEPSVRTFFSKSSVSDTENASLFELDSSANITTVKWVGTANYVGDKNQATFILRIYEGQFKPEDYHIRERIEVVDMDLVRTVRSGTRGVYIFSYSSDPIFSLTPGRYWISIMDPETEAIDFFWEIEPGKAGGSGGSGGAYRPIGEAWASNGSRVGAKDARGHNIQVQGRLD